MKYTSQTVVRMVEKACDRVTKRLLSGDRWSGCDLVNAPEFVLSSALKHAAAVFAPCGWAIVHFYDDYDAPLSLDDFELFHSYEAAHQKVSDVNEQRRSTGLKVFADVFYPLEFKPNMPSAEKESGNGPV